MGCEPSNQINSPNDQVLLENNQFYPHNMDSFPPNYPLINHKMQKIEQKLRSKQLSMDGDVFIVERGSDGAEDIAKDIKNKTESLDQDVGAVKKDVSDLKQKVSDMQDTAKSIKKEVEVNYKISSSSSGSSCNQMKQLEKALNQLEQKLNQLEKKLSSS